MSAMFEKIKEWYKNGLWSEKRVVDAYIAKRITKEECDMILSIKG